MHQRSPVLARTLDLLTTPDGRKNTRGRRPLKADRTLQVLVADLVAARAAAGMTQEEVAHLRAQGKQTDDGPAQVHKP